MTKAYLSLINKALAHDLFVSVFDGEEWQIKKSTSYKAIKEAIESVEMAELRIRNQVGDIVGWAMIIPDLAPDETVADHTHNPLMCELCGTQYD